MAFDANHSYWSLALPESLPPLQQDLHADAVIIGGGFTGLSAAYYLKLAEPQLHVVLLEARRAGNGASGRNGAMLLTMTEDSYFAWSGNASLDKRIYDLTSDNIARLHALSQEFGVDIELDQNGALQVCNTEKLADEGRSLINKTRGAGLPFQFWERDRIADAIGTQVYPGALFDPTSGQLHPGKLVRLLKSAAISVGVEIHEMTPVVHVERGEPLRLTTENGRTVVGKKLLLATNAFTSKLGFLRGAVTPLFEYLGITASLSESRLAEIGWRKRIPFNDSRTEVFYLGLTRDNRVHIGGGPADYVFNNGFREPAGAEQRFAVLREELGRIYPQLAAESFERTWSGVVDYSLDQTPSVGRLPGTENIFYAIGFSGHGVNLTSVFGRIAADLIRGNSEEWSWLPYVNRLPRYTPNEPFRSAGVRLATAYYRLTDPKTP